MDAGNHRDKYKKSIQIELVAINTPTVKELLKIEIVKGKESGRGRMLMLGWMHNC